jgi:predicted RNA-binding protein (virulence factor B family)
MKTLAFTTLALLALLFSGCSGKKYFEPEETFSASDASASYGGTMERLSRNGGTLDDGTYVVASGISTIELGEGYRFLNENDTYVLATNMEGLLRIIDKKNKQVIRDVALHVPVVAATVRDDVVAYILNNNSFGIYNIAENKKVVENRSEETFAIDTRAANPIFIDNLVVMPMLDGKLIIVSLSDTNNAKVIYLSSAKAFNNVIYLTRQGNTMIAATSQKLITLGDQGELEYKENISEVAYDAGTIYLFTQEGYVIALDDKLQKIAMTKHKFAHYAVATAFNGKVYALDQGGSLIVMNSDLSKEKIYDLGEVEEPALILGTKLYKDGDLIELSQLGYE